MVPNQKESMMDIKSIIEKAMNDGELNQEALAKALSENFITKEDANKQINGASARIKAKYEKQANGASTEKEVEKVEEKQAQATDIQSEVEKAMGSYFTKQQEEERITKQLEVVKPEFRDFVKHTMQNSEDFNMDAFLKENSQFKDAVSTRTENVSANASGSKPITEKDKNIMAMLDQM